MRGRVAIPSTKLKITGRGMFGLLISVLLCHYTLFDYFAVVIGKLPVVSIFRPFFFPVLYGILCLLSLNRNRFKWVRASDIVLIGAVVIALLLTIIFYPENEEHIVSSLLSDILPCLPFFFIGLCIDLDEETYAQVSTFCCIAILVSALYRIYFLYSGGVLSGSHGEDYSMYNSYLLLPNTLIAIDYFGKSKKKLPALCSLIGIIYAFAMGTRGPIVILAAHICVCVWRYMKVKTHKKVFILALLGILVVAFVVSPLYIETLVLLRNILIENGLSARVVDYMISGEMISQTSGRDDIYVDLLSKLSERPLTGYGIYGEHSFGYLAGAHNIYLQVVFQFGYPLGVALLMGYIVVFVKALRKTSNQLLQGWIILFGCLVFVKGIFGGNWLDSSVFFLLGMSLKAIREARISRQYNTEWRMIE